MRSIGEKIRHEFRELIPVTVFFFLAFQLLAVTDALILRQYGIKINVFLGAMLAALVVAKVVIITDHFALVNRFPHKPLIYNVVWKTVIYFVAWLAIRYAEHFFHFWRATHDVAAANHRLLEETVWPHFWALQLWMLVLLFVYCAFRELVRALGRERVIAMFFREHGLPAREKSSENASSGP
jgi:hypothetical protein